MKSNSIVLCYYVFCVCGYRYLECKSRYYIVDHVKVNGVSLYEPNKAVIHYSKMNNVFDIHGYVGYYWKYSQEHGSRQL